MSRHLKTPAIILAFFATLFSCKSKDSKETSVKKDSAVINEPVVNTANTGDMPGAPIINMEDTLLVKSIFICVKDSAASIDGVGKKFGYIFDSALSKVIASNKLEVKGHPAAWFSKNEAPYFFEVGMPINKAPAKLSKNVYIKNTGGDSALVAHFFGPYNMTGQAYEALMDRLKDEKPGKKAGKPYEVYVDDPVDEKGNPKNPFKVQTDIILPYN